MGGCSCSKTGSDKDNVEAGLGHGWRTEPLDEVASIHHCVTILIGFAMDEDRYPIGRCTVGVVGRPPTKPRTPLLLPDHIDGAIHGGRNDANRLPVRGRQGLLKSIPIGRQRVSNRSRAFTQAQPPGIVVILQPIAKLRSHARRRDGEDTHDRWGGALEDRPQ